MSKQGKNSSNLKRLVEIAKKKKVKIIVVQAGDRVQIDKNCYFDILFPEIELILDNVLNNNSIVAKFCMENKQRQIVFSMMFTGDIEKIAENKIAELYKEKNILKSTVLKVAHHGSKTSSTEQLIELISPKIAVIRSRAK